ncbi:Hypothetical protein ADU72_1011 [Pediococcus damnosus]|uniref:Uncharacterized protein n=1 Tax=Pediococcus damnosus TaxID=51663 RepID=A0ABM6A3K6_9LACO|nr:Hypothetical protein ADU72_1011 [Pediococcus damnosus]
MPYPIEFSDNLTPALAADTAATIVLLALTFINGAAVCLVSSGITTTLPTASVAVSSVLEILIFSSETATEVAADKLKSLVSLFDAPILGVALEDSAVEAKDVDPLATELIEPLETALLETVLVDKLFMPDAVADSELGEELL